MQNRDIKRKPALGGPISRESSPSTASEKNITMQSVRLHALDTFGTAKKSELWLNRTNPLFNGKTPLEVAKADPSWVEAELVRIDYGVYA